MFCKKCGTKKDESDKTNSPNVIMIKFSHLIISILVLLLIVGASLFLVFKDNQNVENVSDINNIPTNNDTQIYQNYQVEIGVKYSYEIDNEVGSIIFKTDNIFERDAGILYSEGITQTGTYSIENNIIRLTVNNDSFENNNSSKPKIMEMTILDDGNIEYVTEYGTYLYVKEEIKDTSENTNILSEEDSDIELQENANVKLDVNKFIQELGYKSLSTVNDGIHGGDGYRYDFEFYNSGLSINDFKVTNSNGIKNYVLETNGNKSNNYKLILTIKLSNDNVLNEINITCFPPNPQAKGILNCAMEVEDALGYTLFNSRNYKTVQQLESNLKADGYIESTGNYNILTNSIVQQIENEQTGEKIIFEYINNKLSYTISFIDNAKFDNIDNNPNVLQEESNELSEYEQLFNKIEEGMTYAEVCLILGGEPTKTILQTEFKILYVGI